ncbi:hypothetical protein PG984_000172 [Apiospora sp. TS-2023a]
MSELKNIWDDLERSKANKNRNGKWGFTVYRTDYEDQRLWREYLRYLRNTIESTVDPDKDKPPVDPNPATQKTEEDQKTKAKKKIRTRIRVNFELVVVQDPALNGCNTAQVRQYHRQQIEAYLNGETRHLTAPHNHGNDRCAENVEDAAPNTENAKSKKEGCNPPHPSPPPPIEEQAEEEEGQDHHDEEESHHDENEEGENNKPKKQKRPPREEKRVGHVWQDYFLHVNGEVLKKYAQASHQEKAPRHWTDSYHLPFVAIVAEAERSDYRVRRFGAWAGDGSVPELDMKWQYIEVTSIPALYDHLSRLPLGRAQLLAGCGRHHAGGGAGVGSRVRVSGVRPGFQFTFYGEIV